MRGKEGLRGGEGRGGLQNYPRPSSELRGEGIFFFSLLQCDIKVHGTCFKI